MDRESPDLTTYTASVTPLPADLPALPDAPLVGAFDWLTPPSHELDWAVAGPPGSPTFDVRSVDRLEALAAAQDVSLPGPFVTFLRSERRHWVRSWTGCWLELPTRLVKLPGTNLPVVRFLNDQQGVVFWYLVISPDGDDRGVVVSEDLLDADEPSAEAEPAPIYLCGSSFEAFMLRYWLENEILFRTEADEPLSDLQQEYAERWRPHR
ncbi:MAG TPA: hypothetical protein VFV72_03345 [Candidatus Limnocylindrales bacterium]|nr:hypothetical protein [Candidatus Limnocylindrales bacterium]